MIKTAVILAAGYGQRIELYEKPKGFLNIAGKPLIEYSVQALLAHGIEKIIIATGFKAEYYENLAQRYPQIILRRNDLYRTTGSLVTLCAVQDLINEDFLLLESDILYDGHCLSRLIELSQRNVLLLATTPNQEDGVWVQVDTDRNLVTMSKNKNSLSDPLAGILVGITKMSLRAFQQLMRIAPSIIDSNCYQHYDFAFEHLRDQFFVFQLDNLVFTEIDNDDQLIYALTRIYPKLAFPYLTMPSSGHKVALLMRCRNSIIYKFIIGAMNNMCDRDQIVNVLLLTALWYFVYPSPAHAYFDIGVGTYMIQFIFGFGAAFGFSFISSWKKRLKLTTSQSIEIPMSDSTNIDIIKDSDRVVP